MFTAYLLAVGIPSAVLILVFTACAKGISVYSDMWLGDWSKDVTVNGTYDQQERNIRLGVYGGLGLLQCE